MPDAAWLPDPTGRFQYRYWDGTQWSSSVSRQGSQETDALSTQPAPPAAAPAAPPPAIGWTDPAATRAGAPPPPPPGTAAPPPAAAPAAASPPPAAGFSPPPATTGGASGGGRTLAVGDVILGLGIIGIVVSIFLHWLDFSQSISGTQVTQRFTASGVPVQELVNYTTTRKDPTFVVLLIPVAALCVLALLLRAHWLAIVGGIAAVLVAMMYSYQLQAAVHASPQLHGFG
ncbi:MAG TPA: hypothetical protein VN180_06320, partial [Acidimicrobiia bacterium]|nr:hypothetical protein [Acidimicrobiia bacterium]